MKNGLNNGLQNRLQNRFLILTGGTLPAGFLVAFLQEHTFERIICVDGALELVERKGVHIDYLMGDFDTVDKGVLQRFLERKEREQLPVAVWQFQPEKDNTDTDIAVSAALMEGADEITILGATGTRIDHLLANIQLLLKPLGAGVPAYIYDEYNKIYLIEQGQRFCRSSLYGPYISFLPFGGTVRKVTQKGFKYETHEVDFVMGESLGISNELLQDEGSISFESGRLLVVEAREQEIW